MRIRKASGGRAQQVAAALWGTCLHRVANRCFHARFHSLAQMSSLPDSAKFLLPNNFEGNR